MLSLANPGGAFDSTIGALFLNGFASWGPIDMINSVRKLAEA